MNSQSKTEQLIRKGVQIANPQSIEIGEDVDIERISGDGVAIYSGSKIFGPDTYISKGVQIGYEGPATVENCYLGPDVAVKGGYIQEAVFLDGASCGLGSHVRKGTILEEQASIAHTVGLKQTILFPFVTLGSLINFCDCLMAGGTSRKNHSEVGSSYIHFNYTPNQDKATPSIMGDVPRGVMLKQSPIFLGGQGGLVGPCRLAYGTVVAAGTICRKDQLKENHLVMEAGPPTAKLPLRTNSYPNLKRLLDKNIDYIGQLCALKQWYHAVRRLFIGERFAPELLEGLLVTIQKGIDERIKQLGRLRDNIEKVLNASSALHSLFCGRWESIQDMLVASTEFQGRKEYREKFLGEVGRKTSLNNQNYVSVIQNLDEKQAETGILWLQGIVDHIGDELKLIIEKG